ncbi:hypothetical protein STEG23_009799 [Scotinomys teguina]
MPKSTFPIPDLNTEKRTEERKTVNTDSDRQKDTVDKRYRVESLNRVSATVKRHHDHGNSSKEKHLIGARLQFIIIMVEHGSMQTDVEHGSMQTDVVEHGSMQTDVVEHGSMQTDVVEHGSMQTDVVEHGSMQTDVVEHGSMQADMVLEM